MAKDEKTLATKQDMSIVGSMMPSAFDEFVNDGFASVETVVFGDSNVNKLPVYVGRLEGPADAVEVGEEIINPRTGEVKRNTMPCWVFKPLSKDASGAVGVVENVTHIAPCNYMVDAACKRIWAHCDRTNQSAIVGVKFIGSETIKGGSRRLNRYRVFEKYIPRTSK